MKKILMLIVLVVFTFGLPAEDVKTETEFWEVFGVDFPVGKAFKVYLEKQLRYEGKFTNMESDLSEVGLRYRLSRRLDLRVNYRFVSRFEEKRNRLDANIYFRFKFGDFKISNRARFQSEVIEDRGGTETEREFRDRLRLTYTGGKRLSPYCGGEIFVGLGEGGEARNKLRLTGGVNWKVKKRVTVGLFYHFQNDLVKDRSEKDHIFGMKFKYSF